MQQFIFLAAEIHLHSDFVCVCTSKVFRKRLIHMYFLTIMQSVLGFGKFV